MMSHRISNNLKGALGEEFFKLEFQDIELIDLRHGYNWDKLPGIPKKRRILHKDFKLMNEEDENEYFNQIELQNKEIINAIIEKFGTIVLPDYYVTRTSIFLEIKTGKSATLEKNQKEEFPKILNKGFRIFIIKPKLNIEKRKFEVIDFQCYEYLGFNKKGKKILLHELKNLMVLS